MRLLLALGFACLLGAAPAAAVVIKPGDDLQAIVKRHPSGTTFVFEPGLYRLQGPFVPRDGDRFIGKPGVVLSGAKPLTSFVREGKYWVAANQTQEGNHSVPDPKWTNPYCLDTHPRCLYPEDLFIDDKPLHHVDRLNKVRAGTWFFDYARDKIYLADDPSGRKVETSVAVQAFSGPARDVVIKGLTIEKFAGPLEQGAIHGMESSPGNIEEQPGQNWVVEGNEVRLNHSVGVMLYGGQVLRNHLHHNGQFGLETVGNNLLIEGNEISYNNFAGVNHNYGAGATKFWASENLVARKNIVHHNLGYGLWTDHDNIKTLYEENEVYENSYAGILHEISQDAVIRNNVVKNNGSGGDPVQIFISDSRNVEIHHNTIEVPDLPGGDFGSWGILLWQAERGESERKRGPHHTINNYIHHNTILHHGARGKTGVLFMDERLAAIVLNGNNRFDSNTYRVPHKDGAYWSWQEELDWDGFRAKGQERKGTLSQVPLGKPRQPAPR